MDVGNDLSAFFQMPCSGNEVGLSKKARRESSFNDLSCLILLWRSFFF